MAPTPLGIPSALPVRRPWQVPRAEDCRRTPNPLRLSAVRGPDTPPPLPLSGLPPHHRLGKRKQLCVHGASTWRSGAVRPCLRRCSRNPIPLVPFAGDSAQSETQRCLLRPCSLPRQLPRLRVHLRSQPRRAPTILLPATLECP